MATWLREGVILNLHPAAAEEFRKVKRLYNSLRQELMIASGNDSEHLPDSIHYINGAVDFCKGKVLYSELIKVCNPALIDVFEFTDLYHWEYNPK